MKLKLIDIKINMMYEDEDGDLQFAKKDATDFEGAEENLGKLERFIEQYNA